MGANNGESQASNPNPQRGEGVLCVRRVPIASLHHDPANARRHDEKNLNAIAASLAEFGQVEPLVVQKGTGRVIGGNGRLEVMRKSGKQEVDIVEVDVDSTGATALGIALNRTAELATWDQETLASLLDTLPKDALPATGYGEDDLKALLDELRPPVVEDEAPEPLPEAVSVVGDLWEMGDHRLMCGDSTKAEDVGILLAGAVPFIMVTDPPYGVEYDPQWRSDAERADGTPIGARAKGKVANDDRVDWTPAYRLFPGVVAYVWHADRFAADLVVNLRDAGFEIRTQIVWSKPQFVISRGHYHWQHEPCWYAVRGGSAKWCGDRTQSTVWQIANATIATGGYRNAPEGGEFTGHGTQKPVECMARPIRNHGGKDDHVYDPFLGSGTTLIACEQLGRRCYAIEIEPRYVDVAIRRWQKLTGNAATLNGRTFVEVAADRGVEIE